MLRRLLEERFSLRLRRETRDRTELSGTFDVELTYQRSLSTNPDEPAVDFTAVRQQLSFKLEPDRTQFEIGAVESIGRLTPTLDQAFDSSDRR